MYSISEITDSCASRCKAVLLALPEWFGIPEYLDRYAAETEVFPTVGAFAEDGSLVGFVTLHSHNQYTNELHVIGVLPEHHGKGVGRLLVNYAIERSRNDGFELLEVKTLGASSPDPHYARTREFYLHMGFRPVEELRGVWAENPCLVMVMPLRGP
jgi:GNAT superfamily N-acetyltransferase